MLARHLHQSLPVAGAHRRVGKHLHERQRDDEVVNQ